MLCPQPPQPLQAPSFSTSSTIIRAQLDIGDYITVECDPSAIRTMEANCSRLAIPSTPESHTGLVAQMPRTSNIVKCSSYLGCNRAGPRRWHVVLPFSRSPSLCALL